MIIAGSTLAFAASHRFAASHQRNVRMQTCADHCPQPVQAEQATDLFSVSTPPLHGDAYQSGHLAAQARQAKSHQHLTSESRGGTVSDGQDDQVIKLLEQHFGIAGITKFSLDVDYLQSAGVEEAAVRKLVDGHFA